MLSKRCERTLLMGLTALISLTLVAMGPFVTCSYATAVESQETVDIIYDTENPEGCEIDDSQVGELSDEDELMDPEEESDEENEEIDGEFDENGEEIIKGKHGSKRSDKEDGGTKDSTNSEDIILEAAAVADDETEDEDIVIDDQYINEDTDEEASDEIQETEPGISEDEDVEDTEEEDVAEEDEDTDEEADEEESDEEEVETEANTDLNGGFPASYQPLIDELQAAHPNWTFVPVETGFSWGAALDGEDNGGTSVVDPEEDESLRSDSDEKHDGRWYQANRKALAYYMDPRNFLNEDGIYQFLQQSYDADSQNVDTVASVIEGSFMDGKSPGDDFETFQACIENAGEETGVNANVLAAMIIQEQGWEGSPLVSGEKEGYEGFYNFFNIGAWTTDDQSSIERGLWYAQGEGESNTSYERPWDEPFKAIVGGAQFYYENYISNNQATYYTKKFNVLNGEDAIGENQYMTNISGAYEEGRLVSKAYENSGMAATFEIPVYQDMPVDACELPE